MSAATRAVFLSYASQDVDAARKIADALRAAQVEVWFDLTELRGGDAWDANIRKQIKECALFVPVISANTQARREGYFRIEWKLAAQRTHAIADGTPFLLPIVIDDTPEPPALVPPEFRDVQWTRLPSDETAQRFCVQVRKLLGSEGGTGISPVIRSHEQDARATSSKRAVASRRMSLAVFGAAALAALAVWQPWRTRDRPETPVQGAAISEARKLAAKADALFDQDENAPRENLSLAEKYCQQAIALDSNDADIWAIFSRVGSNHIFLTLDRSQERRAQAEDAAARAVKLAPDSYEARYALAYFYRLNDATYPEAERILRQLLIERPQDKRVWRTLGNTLRYTTIFSGKTRGRDSEAVECFRRAASVPGGDPLSLHFLGTLLAALGRLDEGEKALDESLALKPRSLTTVNRTNLMLRYRGNVQRAIEALSEVPVEHLREDYGAFIAAQVWLCARQPDKAIAGLQMLPRDYLEAVFDGPKGALIGQAHQMAGRAQAAQIEWRAALQFVDRRLTLQSNNVRLLVWRAWLLAHLGDHAEAARGLNTAEQLGLSARDAHTAAAVPLAAGIPARAIALLAFALKEPVVTTAAFARINPAWDALRTNPRFEALVKAPEKVASPSAALDQKSIAVLAFKAIGEDKESEIFSEGVSEELLNVLAKVPGLRVAARASAFYFKDKNATAQEMGQKLNVAYLVDGSVQRVGTTARVNARLSRADTGEQVWSEKFDGELKNILSLQDEIAGRIAENLKLKLGGAARSPRAVNPEAYVLLLEGRHFWNLRSTDGFARAEAAITKAIALDPEFAPAHAALADVYTIRSTYALQDGQIERALPEVIARARTAARRAIELDPSLPDAYPPLAYCLFLEMRFAEAEQQFQKALTLNPNSTVAHAWHATLLLSQGRLDRAMSEYETSSALDPLWAVNLTSHVEALNYSRRFADALRIADRARALRPDYIPNLGNRARALFELGRAAEAVETARFIRTQADRDPRRDADSSAIWVLCQAGLRDEALAYAEGLLKTLPDSSHQKGFVFGALGQFEKALPYLERTPPVIRRRLFWDPMWDEWREDPRFHQLMVKLGCVAEYKIGRETLERMRSEHTGKE